MRITESLLIENDRGGYQEVCSDCEAGGLKKHGLSRFDSIFMSDTLIGLIQSIDVKR